MSRQKTIMAKIPWDYRVFVRSELGPEVKLKFLSYTRRVTGALCPRKFMTLEGYSVPSELGPEMAVKCN